MKSRNNLTKIILVLAVIFLFMFLCSTVGSTKNNSQAASATSAPQIRGNAALEYWADTLGNHNGYVQALEEDYLQMKLAKGGNEFFIIMMRPSTGFEAREPGMDQLFLSKNELARYYDGVSIKGELGILCFNKEGNITGAWSAWASISDITTWKEAKLPVLDFKILLTSRRT